MENSYILMLVLLVIVTSGCMNNGDGLEEVSYESLVENSSNYENLNIKGHAAIMEEGAIHDEDLDEYDYTLQVETESNTRTAYAKAPDFGYDLSQEDVLEIEGRYTGYEEVPSPADQPNYVLLFDLEYYKPLDTSNISEQGRLKVEKR